MGALPKINPDAAAGSGIALDISFLPTLSQPHSRAAEAIRSLRTHIKARHLDAGRRALAVCAASAGVGCTFVAANLAISLSQSGLNTLLVDADLRRPKIHKVFRRPVSPDGLQQYLADPEVQQSKCIEESVLPQLSVLFAGSLLPESPELLVNDRFNTLMRFCLRKFDATIIDTSPANTSSDVSRICSIVTYCLLVARQNRSFVGDVKHLADQLNEDRAQVVGTVLCLD